MASDLIKRKITVLFRADDMDKDGFIERSDLQKVADAYSEIRGWEPGSDGYERIHGLFEGFWEGFRDAVDADRDGKASLDETIEGVGRMFEANPEAALQSAQIVFDTLDADGSGKISIAEYRQLLSTTPADPAVADEIFPRLDTNGDGTISREEFQQLFVEFFTSEDPDAPGNWLWGPF